MAQLKDTTVSGSLRATDTIYSTTIQAQILKAPTASNSATYGPGTNGQVLKSNGTSVYWGTDNDSVTGVKGNSESSYRTGNVNITASNIGLGNVENTKLSTWTGSTNITTVGTITTGTWNATTIGAGYGGTGQSTYTVGDILYCGTANTLSKLGGNTTTTRKFLRSVATTAGTAVAPAWDTVTKTDVGLSNVTNDAQVKASLGTAKGDMLYWSASATPARLAIGTAGYFLKATADGPVWANTTDITGVGTVTTGTWEATTIAVDHGGTGITTSSYKNAIIAGNTSSATGAFSTIRTASGALYATAQDGAAQFGTLPVAQGGTGATSFTADSAIISGSTTTSALTTRAITNNTTATAVTASTNLITANTLYYHKGNSNIVTVGTITSGTWQGTAIAADYIGNHSTDKLTSGTLGTARGGTGVSSHTANRLVYSTSATAIQATDKHYASDTQISINSTTAPDSGYTLKVNGALETTNLINIITNSRTKDIYFSNGTPGSCSNVGRIMYDIVSATGITKSQFGFIEYSYPSTAGASALAYSENYYLPTANAGLGASVAYNILTDKNVYPFPMCARQVSSSMTFDDMNAPGVYAVANNIKSTNSYPTSQTNAKYGILVVFGGTNTNNTAGNAMQLWFSGITNAGYYKLAIRAKYNGTWGAWSVIH